MSFLQMTVGLRIARTAADAPHRHFACECRSGVTRYYTNLRPQRKLHLVHLTALGLETAESLLSPNHVKTPLFLECWPLPCLQGSSVGDMRYVVVVKEISDQRSSTE